MRIILLTGPAGVGKTEIARHLEKEHGYKHEIADLPIVQRRYAVHDQDKFVIETNDRRQAAIFRDSYPRDTLVINIVNDREETKTMWDKQIRNNGTLEELFMKVEACL